MSLLTASVLPFALLIPTLGAEEADTPPPVNLLANGSFELGLQNDWAHPFYSDPPLTVTDDTDVTHGKRSLCVPLASLYGQSRTLMLYKPFPAKDGVAYTFSADVKASAEGARLSGVKDPIGRDWRRVSFAVKPKDGAVTVYLSFSRADRFWMDAAMLVESAKAAAFEPAQPVEVGIHTEVPGNCFTEDEAAVVHLLAVSYSEDAKVRPQLSVIDYWGNEIWAKAVPLDLEAGLLSDVPLTVPLKTFGHFRAELCAQKDGPVVGERVLTRMRNHFSPEHRAASPACGHYGHHGVNLLPQAARLGVPINRLHDGGSSAFLWRTVEPEKGKWVFDEADKAVAAHEKYGIGILGILAAAPDWATGEPNLEAWPGKLPGRAHFADWCNYVETLVRRYKGRIKYWEVWNEPYGLPADFYFELAKVTYQAAKRGWPEVQIAAPCGHRAHYWWMVKLSGLGILDYSDIYSYHGYGTGTTGSQGIVSLARADGKPRDLWDTESGVGWGSRTSYQHIHYNPPGKVSAQSTAERATRLITALYAGDTARQFYYWNYNTYYDRCVCVSQGTTFEYDASIRPVGAAQALTGVMLSKLEPSAPLDLGEARSAYLFRGEGLWRAVLWDNHLRSAQDDLASFDPNWTPAELSKLYKQFGEEKRYQQQMSFLSLDLPRQAEVLDLMTNPVPLPKKGRREVLALTPSPVFITLPNLSEAEVRKVFRESQVRNVGYADLGVRPLLGRDPVTGRPSLVLGVVNNTHQEWAVKLTLSDLKGIELLETRKDVTVSAYRTESVFFPVKAAEALSTEIRGAYSLVAPGREPLEGEFEKRAVTARRFAKAPQIDGDLADWDQDSRQVIEMDTSYMEKKTFTKEDISANAWFGWDAANFYVAVRVLDDKYLPAWGLPCSFWNQDSVEFFFDLDVLGDAHDTAMSLDDHQVLTVAGTKEHPDQPAIGPGESFPGMKIGSSRFEGGYILEYSFPLSNMKPVKPEPGTVFGLDFGIDDADAPKKDGGSPYRKLQMQWSTRKWEIWKTPSHYGMVIFVE